jgi:hypothetical protein
MTKLNKKNLSYKRVAREQSRAKKGAAPRKAHVALRIKAVSGKRTKKHQRRVAHREKMREQELESLGLIPEGAADDGDDDNDDDAPEPLPHQAKALADAVVAAKGGRVKGRARKALKVAGLDPKRAILPGQKPKGRAAAAIAAALAARDGGKAGGGASGDVMEE